MLQILFIYLLLKGTYNVFFSFVTLHLKIFLKDVFTDFFNGQRNQFL